MAFFNVKVTLTQESIFDVEIEAADSEDAELVAKTAVWEDDYTDDIRNTLEITDEAYDAEEICDDCSELIDNCECEEEKL
jgi:hypothetical protein